MNTIPDWRLGPSTRAELPIGPTTPEPTRHFAAGPLGRRRRATTRSRSQTLSSACASASRDGARHRRHAVTRAARTRIARPNRDMSSILNRRRHRGPSTREERLARRSHWARGLAGRNPGVALPDRDSGSAPWRRRWAPTAASHEGGPCGWCVLSQSVSRWGRAESVRA